MANTSGFPRCSRLVIAVLFAIPLIACEEKESRPEGEAPVSGNELAAALGEVRPHLAGLNASEESEIDSFIRFSSRRVSALEVGRACEIAGKGLRKADPAVVASFVLAAQRSIHDEFFLGMSDKALSALHDAIAAHPKVGEIQGLRYGILIRDRSGIFISSLESAMEEVDLDEVLRSRPLSLARLLAAAEAKAEQVSGVAEILRHEDLLPDGAKPGLAEELLLKGRESWPEDPVFLAGLVSLYTSDEEKYGGRLSALLEKATAADPENAAWPYLTAVRAFQRGRDQEALVALRKGVGRERLTFHNLERARRVVSCLENLGCGPIQARLNSLVALSDAPYFDLKVLANTAIMRSTEYEETREPEDLDLVLHLPETMNRQFGACFHTPFAQRIRLTILLNGLSRMGEHLSGRDETRAAQCQERYAKAEKVLEALREGEEMLGGREVWGDLHEKLGEQKFRRYVDGVLYGNESAFLIKCASAKNLTECLSLTQEDYPF